MTSSGIYIAIALEPDEDLPVADIVYDGTQWASATMRDGQLEVTVYGGSASFAIPIDDAIASLEEARRCLVNPGDAPPA